MRWNLLPRVESHEYLKGNEDNEDVLFYHRRKSEATLHETVTQL